MPQLFPAISVISSSVVPLLDTDILAEGKVITVSLAPSSSLADYLVLV